jgi:alpha-mannosidase
VDSFGHAGSLPQLLKLGGMNNYVFLRPGPHENARIPVGPFIWEGTDGTRITAFKIFRSYCTMDRAGLEAQIKAIDDADAPATMCFYGVGDHGGGPTIQMLADLEEMKKRQPERPWLFSSPDRYFAQLSAITDSLPVFVGELQPHAIGCYAAHSGIKAAHRRAEEELLSAEHAAIAAFLGAGGKPKSAAIRDAWKELLFNQFHDVLCGTCVREACAEVLDHLGHVRHAARTLETEAVQRLGATLDTAGEGAALLVFNPHPTPWSGVIETDDLAARYLKGYGRPQILNAAGQAVPSQTGAPSSATAYKRRLFEADLPPLGLGLFRVSGQKTERPTPEPEGGALRAENNSLDNGTLHLSLASDGSVALRDLTRKWDVFKAGAGLPTVFADESDTWSHGLERYDDEIGVFRRESAKLVEAGPLRAKLRVRFRWEQSRLTLDYVLLRQGSVLEIQGRVDWRAPQRTLKLPFPINLPLKKWSAETPYGIVTRPTDGKEAPLLQWLDVSAGKNGLGVANDNKYGADVWGSIVRVTLLRGAGYAHHDPLRMPVQDGWFLDQGESEFRLALIPHTFGNLEPVIQAARFLNRPPVVSWEGSHPGKKLSSVGLIEANGSARMEAVKIAENERGLVVRVWEANRGGGLTAFRLPSLNRAWQAHFRSGEVKSFYIPFGKGDVREVNFLEERAGE